MSQAKSDPFDARVLATFVRTDHAHLRPVLPNSEPAQELKLLTRDHQRQVRQQTRLLNQWKKFARAHGLSAGRTEELWAVLKAPQLPVPAHVVRAKARLVRTGAPPGAWWILQRQGCAAG